jgi:hypothetical protein
LGGTTIASFRANPGPSSGALGLVMIHGTIVAPICKVYDAVQALLIEQAAGIAGERGTRQTPHLAKIRVGTSSANRAS